MCAEEDKYPEKEDFGFPIKKGDVKPLSPDKKMKMIKLMFVGLLVLFIVLVGMILVDKVRYASLKSECQTKIDYWANGPGCTELVTPASNGFNMTVPVNGLNDSGIMVTFE